MIGDHQSNFYSIQSDYFLMILFFAQTGREGSQRRQSSMLLGDISTTTISSLESFKPERFG